jgi:uncharacterized protein YkwD
MIHLLSAIVLFSLAKPDDSPTTDAMLAELTTAHNKERKLKDLPPLTLSEKLCKSAAAQVADMAEHQSMDHKGSDGSTVAVRVKRQGYVFVAVAENIARGQKTVDEVMKGWMNSPGHRDNILGDYGELGAARREDQEGVVYWCVNFGRPMPRLKPDEAVSGVFDALNQMREAASRPKLKARPALGRVAVSFARQIAKKEKLELDGDPFKAADDERIINRELRVLMNSGAPTAAEAAKALLGDDAAELDAFDEIGVGYAISESGAPYWCAIFARPAAPKRVLRK